MIIHNKNMRVMYNNRLNLTDVLVFLQGNGGGVDNNNKSSRKLDQSTK